eukprot:13665-Amorphochlora_amoeboformis.AAC.2
MQRGWDCTKPRGHAVSASPRIQWSEARLWIQIAAPYRMATLWDRYMSQRETSLGVPAAVEKGGGSKA